MSDDRKTGVHLELTARWTAAARAVEYMRADRLFADPWADMLAGREGRAWMESRSPDSVAPILLRTRYFDDFLQRISHEGKVRQLVLMAAGLDTRAFRLSWPQETLIFELDQVSVLEQKEALLDSAGARPACQRRVIKVDLTGDWIAALLAAGFKPGEPSGWLLEGFLFYLPNESIIELLSQVSQLAAPASWLGFDIVNGISLTHPLVQPWIKMQADAGAPWLGTMEDPVGFLKARGWKATLTQAGQPDANYGRWPFPVLPTMMPDIPHNWFVTAEKLSQAQKEVDVE